MKGFWKINTGFLAVLGMTTLSAAEARASEIHVRHEAQIAESNVVLGSIADISTTSGDIHCRGHETENVQNERAIAGIILGESPEPGKAVEWSAAEVSKRLRPYRRLLQDVSVKLPDHIVIRRTTVNTVTVEQLTEQIVEAIKQTLPDSSWEVRVTDLRLPERSAQGILIPRAGSVNVVPPQTRPRGPSTFEVSVVNEDGTAQRMWVNGRAQYWAPVAVLKRQVEARSEIKDGDLTWQKRNVTQLMDVPATANDFKSAVSRMTMMPGTSVMRSSLEREMAVHFGEEVDVVAGGDGLIVSLRGIAQQNGYVGDLIRVKSPTNSKILTGTLTAKGTVTVK